MNTITLPSGEVVSYGEVCRRAATLIETRGHCKGAMSAGKRLCVLGALNYIVTDGNLVSGYGRGSSWPVIWELTALLGRPRDAIGLTMWNDAPDRTGPEVCAALRHAAEQMEQP